MSRSDPNTVRMPRTVLVGLVILCGAIGVAAGFAIPPLTAWATSFLPGLPGPLELAASLPTVWLVPIMTVLGLAIGVWLATQADNDALSVRVDADSLLLTAKKRERYVARDDIAAVFTDPKDLVLVGHDDRELYRYSVADISTSHLEHALRGHDYPWRGTTDPHEAQFRRWIDGHPDLDPDVNKLLRNRGDLVGGDEVAALEEATAQLQDLGVVVRDRDKQQQYRKLGRG